MSPPTVSPLLRILRAHPIPRITPFTHHHHRRITTTLPRPKAAAPPPSITPDPPNPKPRKQKPKTHAPSPRTTAAALAANTVLPTHPKTVTAYCAAETYCMSTASSFLRAAGYALDPLSTGLFPDVIHTRSLASPNASDILIFPSGTIVAWDVSDAEARGMLDALKGAAQGKPQVEVETEDLVYVDDAGREGSKVVGDTIILGSSPSSSTTTTTTTTQSSPAQDALLTKLAFSSGLARSTKLAVLESLLATYQESTRLIPATLSHASSHPPFTRRFIRAKTGDLLEIRAQLNLYSELTDALPDMFWDTHHSLRLDEHYDSLGRALDVNARIRVLNEKIGFAQEIANVLRETLSEKHGLRLEWAIIALIAVEVVLEVWRHWDERKREEGTERLWREWLEREMARGVEVKGE